MFTVRAATMLTPTDLLEREAQVLQPLDRLHAVELALLVAVEMPSRDPNVSGIGTPCRTSRSI